MAAIVSDDTASAPAPSDPLAVAAAAVADLGELDLDGLAPEALNEAVVGFQKLRAGLEAAEARVVSRWDAEQAWQLDGAKTGAAWIAWASRLPIQEARRRVRHARALRALPEVADAWAAGEIDRTHLTTMLGVCTPRTAVAFATDHKVLLDAARTLGFVDFRRTCERWEGIVDPDGAERDGEADRAAREVHLAQSIGGMWFGRMTLDPISGTIVHTTLAMIEQELFDADWAHAKERLGRDPLVTELDRTPAQRRADALVEMATRARTAPEGGRRPAPLFNVLVGYETFAGPLLELFDRTVITPGTAARWLNQADIERIVFDGPSRVIDVGAQRRFYRGALRRAIEVRDRTCFHPTCDEVPRRPQIDHIHEAARGGATTQDNGRLGCDLHNLDRNRRPSGPTGSERSSPRLSDPDAGTDRATPRLSDPDAGPDPPDD